MDVPAGLNLHMHTTVPRPADKVPDKMAESRMLFRMGFFGQRLCKSPWSEAVLFSISLAGPPMTDDDCSSNNNFSTPHLPSCFLRECVRWEWYAVPLTKCCYKQRIVKIIACRKWISSNYSWRDGGSFCLNWKAAQQVWWIMKGNGK